MIMTTEEKYGLVLDELRAVKEFLEVELDGNCHQECAHIAHGIEASLRKLGAEDDQG